MTTPLFDAKMFNILNWMKRRQNEQWGQGVQAGEYIKPNLQMMLKLMQ